MKKRWMEEGMKHAFPQNLSPTPFYEGGVQGAVL